MARENLIKLIQNLSPGAVEVTPDFPEYRFLDPWVSDEILEVAVLMKQRVKYSVKELAEMAGISESDALRIFDEMEQIGITETHLVDGVRKGRLNVFVPGIFEMMSLKKEDLEKYPGMAQAFADVADRNNKYRNPNIPRGKGPIRVVPVHQVVEQVADVADLEKINFWIDKYEGHIGVSNCMCRTIRRITGEGTFDLEGEVCLSLGDCADQSIKAGKARAVSTEEAKEICMRAEELGYVHQITTVDGPDESAFICNCSYDSCLVLRSAAIYGTSNFSGNNFVAEVDKNKCVACGQCVEICSQNAVKLGRKLCESTPIEIEPAISSYDHEWGENEWNLDFLTSRENVIKETGTSPCKTECPAHIAVQGYIKLAAEGRYLEALELIKKENPFPAVCGRVCPHNCEGACTRGDIDEPVAIDDIKRFIADQELKAENRFVPKKIFDKGKKIAVVGAGPAGLSCAYFLSIYGHEVTVYEKNPVLGGMLTLGIPDFRLGKDIINSEIDVLKELGVQFVTNCEIGKDKTIDALKEEGFEGFYLAVGAQKGRYLGLEGEEADEVMTGVDFLREVSLENDVKLSGNVIVIGGGNVAIDVARTATRVGSDTVSMYCLESREEMPAIDEEIQEAEYENIVINNSFGPKRIITENGKVTGVEFKKVLSVFNEEGRFAPTYDENNTIIVQADYVLLSVGQAIDWGNLLEGLNIELNPNNTIQADSFTYATSEMGIFAGGDAFTGPRFAIDAIAAGRQGAESLHRAVWEGHSLVLGRDRREYHSLDKGNVKFDENGYDKTSRQRPLHLKDNDGTFKDSRATLTEEQVKLETSRCLECGAAIVEPTRCVGCGVCTTRCKFDAIKLKKVMDVHPDGYEGMLQHVSKYAQERQQRIKAKTLDK